MRRLMAIGIIFVLLLIVGCSKGNVISGSTVVDVTQEQATNSEPIKEEVESLEAQKEDFSKESDSDDSSESGLTGQVVAEVVAPPDYSDEKGTCTKDSIGVVRIIDDSGKKAVYRAECLGGLLVTYGCTENGQLDTNTERCPSECVVENRKAQCA